MNDEEDRRAGERPSARRVVYCVVPRELAGRLHDLLRRHFRDRPEIEVIVERRGAERRREPDRRRRGDPPAPDEERRRVRGATGRRVGERRAPLVALDSPPRLPRRAARFAERIRFFERLEPASDHAEDLDTARLVTRFQLGDRDVFAMLYERYFDRVYANLRGALRDSHEAEDATQQVFMKVFESLPDYERRRQPFRAWLFTIVRNQAVDELRRRGRVDVMEPDELVENGERDQGDPDLDALQWLSDPDLLLLTERLPEPQRQVLFLRFMVDLSDRQIAQVLNRSPSAVRTLQSRALSFLRQRLSALGRAPRSGRRRHWRRHVRQAPVLRMRRHSLSP